MNKKRKISACSIDRKSKKSPKEEKFKGSRKSYKFLSKESNPAPKFGKNTYTTNNKQLSWPTRKLSKLLIRSLVQKEDKSEDNSNRQFLLKKSRKK
jgi:hypothetical protein